MAAMTHSLEGPKEIKFYGPIATDFYDSNREHSRKFFFLNNPWKVCSFNDIQKIYRFCICCGKNRFTDTEWCEKNVVRGGDSSATCGDFRCDDVKVSFFIPSSYTLVKSDLDKLRINKNYFGQYFQEVDSYARSKLS